MNLDQILLQVDPKWHADFRRYVTTGVASEDFGRYFDASPECQEAADAALIALFAPFAKAIESEKTLQEVRECDPA